MAVLEEEAGVEALRVILGEEALSACCGALYLRGKQAAPGGGV